MEVLGVYDKYSKLRCNGKGLFKQFEAYFASLPSEYSSLYYKNKESVKILRLDKLVDEICTGKYNNEKNVIVYSESDALGHELVHMATNDIENKRFAIDNGLDIEYGLYEGMTEYIASEIYDFSYPNSYPFEVFCVSMLEEIPNFFRHFFIPNGEEFVKLFPKQKDIYSLMYALSVYQDKMNDYLYSLDNNDALVDYKGIVLCIKSIINHLITIQLSFEKSDKENIMYAEKFMDLINNEYLKFIFSTIYPDYINYANKVINRKIKKKR